jgi:flavin-dependent dehydrogenase
VDATGRRAALARALGARRERRDRLIAVYAVLRARGGDEDSRTLVEAAPDGWWYSALIPGRRRVVAFMTDSDLAPPDLRVTQGFAAAASGTEHIAALLPAAAVVAGPRTAAAHSGRLTTPAGDGWLAVGDAALAFDPLSSQGIFNSLFTGMVAGQAFDAWLERDPTELGAYATRLAAIDAGYQRGMREFYALERRWPQRPFWRRRHGQQHHDARAPPPAARPPAPAARVPAPAAPVPVHAGR